MVELPITWEMAFGVWWAFSWRMLTASIVIALPVALVAVFAFHPSPEQVGTIGRILGIAAMLIFGPLAMQWALEADFRNWRIVVVARSPKE